MFKKSLVAMAAVASFGLGAVGPAHADAIAQSILLIDNFIITASNPGAITGVAGSNSATVSLTYNGVNYAPTYTPVSGTAGFVGFAAAPVSGQADTGSAYTPYTPLLPLGSVVTSSFGNASSELSGGALSGGADAKTDATLSVLGVGSGTASSTLGVTATFSITLTNQSQFTFDFLADPFLRAFVDPLFSAQAGMGFNIQIAQGSTDFFSWAPDGSGGAISGGSVIYDACDLNSSVGQTLAGEQSYTDDCSTNFGAGGANQFRATTGLLNAGTYQFKISHFSNASLLSDVNQVPEPSSLLLAGLALAGAGFVGRRRHGR